MVLEAVFFFYDFRIKISFFIRLWKSYRIKISDLRIKNSDFRGKSLRFDEKMKGNHQTLIKSSKFSPAAAISKGNPFFYCYYVKKMPPEGRRNFYTILKMKKKTLMFTNDFSFAFSMSGR